MAYPVRLPSIVHVDRVHPHARCRSLHQVMPPINTRHQCYSVPVCNHCLLINIALSYPNTERDAVLISIKYRLWTSCTKTHTKRQSVIRIDLNGAQTIYVEPPSITSVLILQRNIVSQWKWLAFSHSMEKCTWLLIKWSLDP
jgi:hypothetical protein